MLSFDGFCAINVATSAVSSVESLLFALITKSEKNRYGDRGFFREKPIETHRTLNCQPVTAP